MVEEKKPKKQEEELSEEDQALKSELEALVERLKENNMSHSALESLGNLIKTSTSSMTSVPKPLKFLGPHYETLVSVYKSGSIKGPELLLFSDILSVLSMTYAEEGKRLVLEYRLAGEKQGIESWGHEYVRHLAMEVAQEYAHEPKNVEELRALARILVQFFLSHNAEADACDLMIEMESSHELLKLVDANTWERVSRYLTSCVNYMPYPEDVSLLKTVRSIYKLFNQSTRALAIAMRLNDIEMIKQDFECKDPLIRKQLAFMLARQQIRADSINSADVSHILNNSLFSEFFLLLGKELEIKEAKTPEDIYKTHLENTKASNLDSAKHNLASSIVNGFVNVGFCKDKLMMIEEGAGDSWIFKNKGQGMTSAAASIGLLMMWDVENGLGEIDKYLSSNDDNIKAGALLAIGLVNVGVKNESDPALALLSEYLENPSMAIRSSAILGLGLAYAGSARSDIQDLLLPFVSDPGLDMQLVGFASLSLGFIFVGTCNGDLTSTFLQTMMERQTTELNSPFTRFLALGLGLIYLGKQEAVDATLETLKVIEHDVGKYGAVIAEACAYSGTGNVLKVQEMLHVCNDHIEQGKDDIQDTHQAFAVIGIALISIGEDVGAQMALRMFNHLMHYGEPVIRRAVPLALGLSCASNPQVNVLDTLGKYSHDNDLEVAKNAILAMGLVGCGTNNARLAQMLRQLASYYYKQPDCLFLVRISQGLVHMGKGTVSIHPFHTDRTMFSPVALCGLLSLLVACTESKPLAIYPRFLITLDENLKSIPVSVRVGQAVDTVGQAGKPKTITGFQTHSTPVLMGFGERAELATEEYISIAHVLEGFVIVKKNPNYIQDEEMKDK